MTELLRPSSRADVLVPALGAFGMVFLVFFLGGSLLQLVNLPFGLMATGLLVFGAGGLVLSAACGQRPLRFTGLSSFPAGAVALAFVVGLVNVPFANFVMGAMKELLPPDWSAEADATARVLAAAGPAARVALAVAAALAAPLGEELFFRGWMQGIFRRVMSGLWAAGVTAVLFSAIHLDRVGFAARVELGLLFGLARLWSGSLWPAIALHAAHNGLSMAVLYLFTDDPLAELEQPFPWAEAAWGGAVSLLGVLFLMRVLRGLRSAAADETPLRFTPAAAMPLFAVAFLLAGAATATIVKLRERLPGSELAPMLRQLAPPRPDEAPPSPVPPLPPPDAPNPQ